MSTWNYRLIKKTWPNTDEVRLDVHEVYYRVDGSIDTWTLDPVSPCGETLEEYFSVLDMMKSAASKPILTEVNGKLVEDTAG